VRRPSKHAQARFREACLALAELSAEGFEIYVSPGSVHLMIGPSHDGTPLARALRENIADTVAVPRISGGDW